jgi:hypothetical protein
MKELEDCKEELAELSHEIWSHWMKYLFSKCNREIGGSLIPDSFVEHWKRQIDIKYKDLTEQEKDSDREQADKIIKLLKNIL